MRTFHKVRGIPVQSVVLIPDRKTALDYPKRDLRLGFCPDCGFIANTVYDATVHDCSPQYEETQEFSPTFNRFARSLASRLIEEHNLRDKRVLEIGCGKGGFITLLCESGMREGVGIDPACVPGRLAGPVADRIQFLPEFYGEEHARLQADLVCCRHTLEHIGPVHDFLSILRRNLGERMETIVFCEVPDALRILREAAFWDIYYEHCSYFTAGSLGRLFRRSGFEVLDLRREYDGQYLTLTAKPAMTSTNSPLQIEEEVEELSGMIADCEDRFAAIRRQWKLVLDRLRSEGKRTVLWGSGSKAVGFITTLGLSHQLDYVVDINPRKMDHYMPGTPQRIVAPAFLKEYRPDCVIVMNPVYMEEIRKDLEAMGLEPELMALGMGR